MGDDWRKVVRSVMDRMGPQSDAAVREWEAEQERLRLDSAMRTMDLPARVRDDLCSPGLDTEREPIPRILAALAARQTLILLAGIPGTGKTVAATWVAHRLPGAFFVRLPHWVALASSHRTAWDAERATLRSSLVVDEVGEEEDWQRGKVDQLLATRYDMAPAATTLVTTNLELPAFAERYGERIASRFRDPRYCAVITCRDTVRPKRGKQ